MGNITQPCGKLFLSGDHPNTVTADVENSDAKVQGGHDMI